MKYGLAWITIVVQIKISGESPHEWQIVIHSEAYIILYLM